MRGLEISEPSGDTWVRDKRCTKGLAVNQPGPPYDELEIESDWIVYLRSRLPFSFQRIDSRGKGGLRYFVLSWPVLLEESPFGAKCHNYWRRGGVSYVSGRLLDLHSLSSIMQGYGMLEELRRIQGTTTSLFSWPTNPHDFYDSMQVEKI